MVAEQVKVVIAIKKSLLLDGLAAWLDNDSRIRVLGKCRTGMDCIKTVKATKPSVVILHTNIVDCNYIETAIAISRGVPESKILILAAANEYHDMLAGFRAGARAYVSEDIEMSELVQDITRVNSGEVIISPQLSQVLLEELATLSSKSQTLDGEASVSCGLSAREREVLGLVAKGKTNKEIGMALYISENTVKTHISNIMEKMHARNRSEVTILALERNLIDTIRIRD